jgi:hypothetical protein
MPRILSEELSEKESQTGGDGPDFAGQHPDGKGQSGDLPPLAVPPTFPHIVIGSWGQESEWIRRGVLGT